MVVYGDLKRRFNQEGWKMRTAKGSHLFYSKGERRVAIPNKALNETVKLGLLNNILKKAGWKE